MSTLLRRLGKTIALFLFTCAVALATWMPAQAQASAYSDTVDSVLSTWESVNSSCSGAPQQLANGTYRMTELLAVLAYELDSTGVYGDLI